MSEALSPGWPPRPLPDATAHRRDQLALARYALSITTDRLTDELTPEDVAVAVAAEAVLSVLARRVHRGAAPGPAFDAIVAELRERVLR